MYGSFLDNEASRFAEIRRRILDLYPEIDDQTLSDTLEGATNLNEALELIVTSAVDDETLANALKSRIEQMRARFNRLCESARAKRQAALEAMEKAELRKLTFAEFTISLRSAARSVVVNRADQIPAEFWLPQEPKLDKETLRKALLSGAHIPGAALSDDRLILSVRNA